MTATDLDLDALLDALTARARERAEGRPLINEAGVEVTPYAATGRLVVHPGDTILSTWGNTTYDQTVQTYLSTTDRDAQWPAPKDGAVAYTQDTGTVWVRRAGLWIQLAGPPPPVTSGSGVQTVTDATGEVWVAKNGVNGGAWKKARDVLHARWQRSAAWTLSTTNAPITLDLNVRDPYGLWTGAAMTAPVPGLWRAWMQVGATVTATGQWLQARIYQGGTILAATQNWGSGSASLAAPVETVVAMAAGDAVSPNGFASAGLAGLTLYWTAMNFDFLGTG